MDTLEKKTRTKYSREIRAVIESGRMTVLQLAAKSGVSADTAYRALKSELSVKTTTLRKLYDGAST